MLYFLSANIRKRVFYLYLYILTLTHLIQRQMRTLITTVFPVRFFLFLLLSYGNTVTAQNQGYDQISFSSISLNEGLSQSTVFSIAQDNTGNMWFATYDGVNKYNGYHFTAYQHDATDPKSIASDIARVVITDSKGRVWIGTRDGLSYYNEEKDFFQNYFYTKNGIRTQINGIAEIDSTRLLVSTNEELLLFDIVTGSFSESQPDERVRRFKASTISRQGDYIYIGTANGLYTYSVPHGRLELFTRNLENRKIQSVLIQSPTRLWVGTEGSGLYLFNPKTGTMKNYRHIPGNEQSISSNYIRSLAIDSQNRLWIGTFNDLNIYHEANDSFVSYTSNPLIPGSLSQNSVRSIFMDSQGGMWLGTFFGGLNYYHPLKNRFINIRRIPYQNSLSDNVVSCMVEDRSGQLWIGTNDEGVNRYNPVTGHFTHYTLKEHKQGSISSNNIKTIYPDDGEGKVYIGAHAGGLSILHQSTGHIEHLTTQNSSIPNDDVYAVIPGGSPHTLWIGTLSTLVRMDTRTRKFEAVERERDGTPIPGQRITTLFRDSKQRIWIGGEEGLRIYTEQVDGTLTASTLIQKEEQLANAFVQCVYEAPGGIFWIGTRGGAYSYNERNGEITHYTTLDGLPNNVIYGILADSFGHLWMSTNKGLACFNPNTKSFRNFTRPDGIQSNQFNAYAYCRTSSGQMYFGGINGITTFRPETLIDNPYAPPVVFTELRLFNRSVKPDDNTGILTQHISRTRSITLSAQQSAFTLEFVVPNYISGQHNTFAYRLEGYDKEWYYLTDQHAVSYSNLPHGKYLFMVKAANSDGKWHEHPTTLEIVILPIWYKTWWARSLFTLAAIAFVTFVFRFFLMRKTMENKLAMERMDKEHQEEINQMKMRFFINISHELRTPLTLILAPLQEVINRINDRWTRNQLDYIRRNANRLLYLVNQLMDYRRAELGVFELHACKGDAHRLIKENFLFYDKLAQQKKIQYHLHSEVEGKELLFDVNYLELIANNLFSNAFKYTGEGKSITVFLREENNFLVLEVKDTGIGIPIDKQARIFERFYQVERDHAGSGIGLSLVQRLVELHHGHIEFESREHEGSRFSVYLPQDETLYTPNELTSGNEEAEVRSYSTNPKDMYFIDTDSETTPPATPGGKKRGTILIVEDNREIRHYLREGLSELFNILEAGNGEEAISLLEEHETDVILTDVMMPVMDGIKLCKHIKQSIRTCHIPVIMLSAKNSIKNQLEGLQMGADDYIAKPFTLSVVTTKIQNLMRTRYHMLERYAQSREVEPEKITFNAMDEAILKRAVLIVEKNIDNIAFSADDFAREMGMSRSNLHLKLKAITGESTIDFIRKIRFNEACRLLQDGRYTVAEVSSMVGFNTPSYFATSFKKYFGCLPTEYMRRQREEN